MSRNSSPKRSYLVEILERFIKDAGYQVYPFDKPDNTVGGWTEDPSKPTARYIPYTIINPTQASSPLGTAEDSGAIWQIPFSFHSYGASGTQTGRQSDRLRKLVNEMTRTTVDLGGESWDILKVLSTSIGAIIPNKMGAKPIYSEYDTIVIWLSKEQ